MQSCCVHCIHALMCVVMQRVPQIGAAAAAAGHLFL
jgi:hypothetical protein